MNLAFLSQNIDYIERHYTEDKEDEGLDISTSSNLQEMIKLQTFCNLDLWHKDYSIKEKIPNQGELQNMKDLGSSYYFKKNYQKGELINLSDFEVRSPCRGVKVGSFEGSIRLARDGSSGEALTFSHIKEGSSLTNNYLKHVDFLNISLPVRLHDFEHIEKTFNIKNYEWHLSYKEVPLAEEVIIKKNLNKIKDKNFSIHLPDYISSNHLIDPISANSEVKKQSIYLIDEVARLASSLQEITGNEVPIVGSFSVLNQSKENFYAQHHQVISDFSKNFNVKIMPQFLPRLAWYFGGSVKLDVFCSIEDLLYFKSLPHGICLDTAHCIMAANYEMADSHEWITSLLDITHHIHISDAIGVDGEGVKFGSGDLDSSLELLLKNDCRKVIEQWEGHLNNFEGFKESINYLIKNKL
jgi:N-acetylneuraminate synthase